MTQPEILSWAVVTDWGDVEVKPDSPLALRIQSAERTVDDWRIAGIRWVTSNGRKSWIAYIERPGHFIAPTSRRSPAAAINEAVRCARLQRQAKGDET